MGPNHVLLMGLYTMSCPWTSFDMKVLRMRNTAARMERDAAGLIEKETALRPGVGALRGCKGGALLGSNGVARRCTARSPNRAPRLLQAPQLVK